MRAGGSLTSAVEGDGRQFSPPGREACSGVLAFDAKFISCISRGCFVSGESRGRHRGRREIFIVSWTGGRV